jgi:hypothetical protein
MAMSRNRTVHFPERTINSASDMRNRGDYRVFSARKNYLHEIKITNGPA